MSAYVTEAQLEAIGTIIGQRVKAKIADIPGGGGSQQVFVQQARPATPGPWTWWKTNAAGQPINLIINDGNP
jgi:hypothetical protein